LTINILISLIPEPSHENRQQSLITIKLLIKKFLAFQNSFLFLIQKNINELKIYIMKWRLLLFIKQKSNHPFILSLGTATYFIILLKIVSIFKNYLNV